MAKDERGHGSNSRGGKGKYPKKELRRFGRAHDLMMKAKTGTFQQKAMKKNRTRLQGEFREALAKR